MIGRVSLLVLGLTLLPGCGSHRKGAVAPDVLTELTNSVNQPGSTAEQALPAEPEPSESLAPSDVRGLSPFQKDTPQPLPPSVSQGSLPAMPPEQRPDPIAPKPAEAQPVSRQAPQPPPAILPTPPAGTSVVPVVDTTSKAPDPIADAFRCFREGKTSEGRDLLRKVDPASREALAVLLPLAARLAEACKDGKPEELSSMVGSLEGLARSLRPRASLALGRLCFCRGVERYGVYDPLPEGHTFQAAGGDRPGDLVQVYSELRNFCCQKSGAFSETALSCTLEIHDQRGHVAWRQDRPAQVEQSRSPRCDGYLSCHFYVPPRLPPGDYTLWIHVKDQTGFSPDQVPAHRIARRSLPFHVRGPGVARAGG